MPEDTQELAGLAQALDDVDRWPIGRWSAGSEHGIRSADGVLRDESRAVCLSVIEDGFDHEKRRSLGQELAHIKHRWECGRLFTLRGG